MGEDLERLIRLEEKVKAHAEEIEEHGGTLDHVVNTIDSMLIPTQRVHTEKLVDLREDFNKGKAELQTINEYVAQQRGAWALIVKIGVVVGASASIATLVMKLFGK